MQIKNERSYLIWDSEAQDYVRFHFEEKDSIMSQLEGELRQLTDASIVREQQIMKSFEQADMMLKELEKKNEAIQKSTHQLKATSEYISRVSETMSEILIVLENDETVRTVNRKFLNSLGYEQSQVIGWPLSELIPNYKQHQIEKDPEFQSDLISHNGMKIPHLFRSTILRNSQGKKEGYVLVGTDISEMLQSRQKEEALYKQLIDSARMAGMAEVATGVLHNVGNVLNSVNVSGNLLLDLLTKSPVLKLSKALTLIKENEKNLDQFITQDPRGKLILPYLIGLDQMIIANVADHVEPCDPLELVEDAIKINSEGIIRHGVLLERQLEPLPKLMLNRHKIVQILVNFISNAKYAVTDLAGVRKVVVRVTMNNMDTILFEVIDNGIGISEENLIKIFQLGFTTRKTGHGFGLHSAAIAAEEMGGKISVQSPGLGQGANFSLSLPMVYA